MAPSRTHREHHPPVVACVVSRERSHRRAGGGGVIVLLLLGVLPIIVNHTPIGLEDALTGVDHVGALCVAALHLLLAPVHGGFHLLLGAGVAYAMVDRGRAWRRLSRALSPLDVVGPRPGDAIWRAAAAAGVSVARIRVVAGLPNPAFTVGSFSPTIYVAAELTDRLDAVQLRSVLSHEAAHVARLDPLRFSLLRALGCALFWIPALARLAEDLRDDSEIVADDLAADCGEPLALASAILTLADWRNTTADLPQGAVGFCHGALLERRVRRLLGEEVPVTSHVTRGSLGIAAAMLTVVWVSGVVTAHPLAATDRVGAAGNPHCAHDSESPLAHLFCRGMSQLGGCPHQATRPSPAGHTD